MYLIDLSWLVLKVAEVGGVIRLVLTKCTYHRHSQASFVSTGGESISYNNYSVIQRGLRR